MFCGYVVFDTQMIIEKASMGDKDSLKHTLELFLGTSASHPRIASRLGRSCITALRVGS